MSYLLAVSKKSAQIAERSLFFCGIQFCLAKFLTQNFVAGLLLIFSSSENIRTVIYDYVAKVLGLTQSSRQCAWWMDGRNSHHLPLSPVLQEKAYVIQIHMQMITLHHRTLAVLSFKFQWYLSRASHKTRCYIFSYPLTRLRPCANVSRIVIDSRCSG